MFTVNEMPEQKGWREKSPILLGISLGSPLGSARLVLCEPVSSSLLTSAAERITDHHRKRGPVPLFLLYPPCRGCTVLCSLIMRVALEAQAVQLLNKLYKFHHYFSSALVRNQHNDLKG